MQYKDIVRRRKNIHMRKDVTGKWVTITPCCDVLGVYLLGWRVSYSSFEIEMMLCPRCENFTYNKTYIQGNGCCNRLDPKRVTLKDKRRLARVFPELREYLSCAKK